MKSEHAGLLAYWRAATPDQRRDGAAWYKIAHRTATDLAITYGTSVEVAAGVIAALSPLKSWTHNLALAADCLAGETPRTLGAQARTACLIRDEGIIFLNGPKVSAFYRAIMGDTSAVVVDRWMLRAMGYDETYRMTPKRYGELAQFVRDAAAEVGVAPAVFQATVWCAIRGRSF